MTNVKEKIEELLLSNKLEVTETKRKRKPIEWEINKNGCWVCTSHPNDRYGYPKFAIRHKSMLIDRYLYEKVVGEIPKGFVLRHKCDNRACINPEHLETGTVLENVQDRNKRNRTFKKLTQEQVDEIRKDIRSYRVIAKDYGVACSCISNIKNYKYWRVI